MRAYFVFSLVGMTLLLSGCAAPTKYSWGNYERSLYAYHKDATKSAELAEELKATIEAAESTKARVAPGLYAEYGYLLMQQGKSTEAITQFEKEKEKWPESNQLMNTMIKIASAPAKQTAQK